MGQWSEEEVTLNTPELVSEPQEPSLINLRLVGDTGCLKTLTDVLERERSAAVEVVILGRSRDD